MFLSTKITAREKSKGAYPARCAFVRRLKRPPVSLYQKFALVIILFGIMPIALLSTALQNQLFQEYERGLLDSYRQGLRYVSGSLGVLFDGTNDISKFSYYYSFSSEGTFNYDFLNYDNLRRILVGDGYPPEEREERVEREMNTFLRNIARANSTIEAAHFLYEPEPGRRREYHHGNNNSGFISPEEFAAEARLDELDKESRELILIPSHPFSYAQSLRLRGNKVFTVARNYYNLTQPVGQETYVGTLFVDYGAIQIADIVEGIDLAGKGTLFVCNATGDCFYSTDADMMRGSISPSQIFRLSLTRLSSKINIRRVNDERLHPKVRITRPFPEKRRFAGSNPRRMARSSWLFKTVA